MPLDHIDLGAETVLIRIRNFTSNQYLTRTIVNLVFFIQFSVFIRHLKT